MIRKTKEKKKQKKPWLEHVKLGVMLEYHTVCFMYVSIFSAQKFLNPSVAGIFSDIPRSSVFGLFFFL